MEYHCISADCHIDICWLPKDLFVANASQAMKARMPKVVDSPEGPHWVTPKGYNLGYVNAVGPAGRKYIPGNVHRADRMATTGLYDDGKAGVQRVTTPALRLKDQDRDGVQAEVIYGILGAGNNLQDPEAAIEMYRIYNDWLAEFCTYDRQRLVGLASIPSGTVEAAVAEARRVARLGVGGLDFSPTWDMTPLWNPYWEPLWKAVAEIGLPLHFHTIGRPRDPVPDDLPATAKLASTASRVAVNQMYPGYLLTSVIHSGALERHPRLRIVLGESGIGWIPYVLRRMDDEWEDRFKELPIKMKPSAYWRRQCRATFQNDEIGVRMIDVLGPETVMWASDYPHPDGVWPDSQEYIRKQFSHLPADVRRKITCENAGTFYGLMPG